MTLASTIGNQIIEAILSQRLAPDARLGEQELAQLFSCSRTIVREAMVDLCARGIVTVSPRRGWYLTEVDIPKARELYLAREIIETGLIRSLARPGHAPDGAALDRIAAHLRDQAEALASPDVSRRSFLLGDFHVCLAKTAGNEVLSSYLRDLTVLTVLFTTRYQTPGDAQRSYDEHVAVFEALARSDFAAAEHAMCSHLRTWEEKVHVPPPSRGPLSALRQALTPRAEDETLKEQRP